MGIWPPSKRAGTPPRARVPFVPRPAVLPFDPSPRPTRVFAVCAPGAGRRWCTFSVFSAISVHLLHGDEVPHRLDHAPDLRAVLLDDDVTDPLQPQGAKRVPLVLLTP